MTLMCGDRWLETGNPFAEGDMSESKEEWYKVENARLAKQVEQLIKDLHRIDAARQAAVSQCAAMAERIDELERELAKQNRDLIDPKDVMIKLLQDTNNELQGKLDDITVIMLGGAVGERGHACMSVDGGNL